MKFIIMFFLLLNLTLKAQNDCPLEMDKSTYVMDITELTKAGLGVQLLVNVKSKDGKNQKLVFSSIELARLFDIDFYNDSTFSNRVFKLISDTCNVCDLKFNIDNYRVSENVYLELSKHSPCEIYEKYFNKDGGILIERYFYYGELSAVVAYLIDNYSVIVINHLTDFCVMTKPCCDLRR
jgi:hypothetical protein